LVKMNRHLPKKAKVAVVVDSIKRQLKHFMC